jgi:hypothetical protein
MKPRRDRTAGRPGGARRAPFLGTGPPRASALSCWEIHREGAERFDVYFQGMRIGRERGPAELRELLAGARVRREDVGRVIAALGASPIVWLEVRPAAARRIHGDAAEPRF